MIFRGLPISSGVALAPVYLYRPAEIVVPRDPIAPEQVASELACYARGREAAAAQLAAIHDALASEAPDKAAIFQAHLEILNDVAMIEEVEDAIGQLQTNAANAVDMVYTQYAGVISALDDPMMRERSTDLMDVRSRLLCCLLGISRSTLAEITQPSVVVARELMPSDTATMDAAMVCAIVTEEGGTTSHSAILARSLGIPAVSGLKGIVDQLADGELLAVRADEGLVESSPDAETAAHYEALLQQYQNEQALIQEYLYLEPAMKDGEAVQVCLNIGSDTDPGLEYREAADGVGLFRSEFLYMQSSELPDEETQLRAYSAVARHFGEKQVVIRTMDIGGDKQLPALPLDMEANPFLGYRALRLCFDREDLFRTQLRAILRAAVHGNLAVMFPMVSSLEDIRRAREALAQAAQSLKKDGLEYRADLPVGIMIEIPSIALLARQAAQEVDFASVGTNDLCQYLLAADRMNPHVASWYQPYHPAVFRLIGHIQSCFRAVEKPLSICGEMGGDPVAALGLMSMGVRKLSMNPAAVAPVKRLIRHLDSRLLQAAQSVILASGTAEELESGLKAVLNSAFI